MIEPHNKLCIEEIYLNVIKAIYYKAIVIHHKATVIKRVWKWPKDIHIDKRNRVESLEISAGT